MSRMEQLRQALRDVLPNATEAQINRVAEAVLKVAHPMSPEKAARAA